MGVIVLFWFQFDRIRSSKWFKLPLCTFKCNESQSGKQYKHAAANEAHLIVAIFFYLGLLLLFFFKKPFFSMFLFSNIVNDKTHRHCNFRTRPFILVS